MCSSNLLFTLVSERLINGNNFFHSAINYLIVLFVFIHNIVLFTR